MSSVEQLTSIKQIIESFTKDQQLQILKILKENNVSLNENSNGTFINMTALGQDIIEKLNEYIQHINVQESELNINEKLKDSYKENYFKT